MTVECGLDDSTLDATAASVNQAHFGEPRIRRRIDEFLDNGWNISRRERVEVELARDRNPYEVVGHGFRYSAVTTVLIPPRTEKSPTTVMRRG